MKRIAKSIIIGLTFLLITSIAIAQEKWEINLRKDFEKVLKSNKNVPEKHRDLIEKWKEEGHLSDLTTLYESVKPNKQDDAPFFYGLGYVYVLANPNIKATTDEKAIDNFETAIQLDPSLFWAHYSLGAVFKKHERYDEALTKFKTCLTLNRDYYPAHYYIGEIHLEQGNHSDALSSFQIAQSLNSKWVYPIYGIGLVYLDQGDHNQARETFERAIQYDPKFAPAYIKLGQILAMDKFYDDALQEYQKSSEYQPYTGNDVFDLAVIFADTGNADGAIQLYQRTLELDPTHGPAHLAVADILYSQGDTKTAAIHYKKAIEQDPTLKDHIFKPLEPYYVGIMSAEEARQHLEKIMSILPNDPRPYFYLGKLEADSGNIPQAIENYNKTREIVELDPSFLDMELPLGQFNDVYFILGELYYKQDKKEEASINFKRALQVDPTLKTRFLDEGKNAFDNENYKGSILPLNKHLLLFPNEIKAIYLLGQSYEADGNTENALQYYNRTIELDPNRSDVLYKMVHIYRETESHQNALNTLKKLITLDANDSEAHYLSALTNLSLGNQEEALSAFLETIRLIPDNVDAQYQAGLLYEDKGDLDNALIYYEETIKLDTENPEPFFKLGGIYQKRNDEDNMIRVYQPALILEPNHPNIQYKMAKIFEKRSKTESQGFNSEIVLKAFHHYGLANEHDPEHYEWHYQFARLLDLYAETLDEFVKYAEMAVNEYTTTIALKPDFADAYYYRAMITNRYKRIGEKLYRSSQILEDFNQVVELDPKNVNALFHIGTLQLWIEKYKLAEETFKKVIQLDPTYKGVHTQLGELAERNQEFKKAIELYEKELTLDVNAIVAYQRLGDLYYNSEMQLNKAKEMLEKALELSERHVPTILVYANVLYSMDQLGSAADQFERAIQFEPRNLTANYNLALMYQYSERIKLAKEQWKHFLGLNPPEQWKIEAENNLSDIENQ